MPHRVEILPLRGTRPQHYYPKRGYLIYETNKSIRLKDDKGKIWVFPKNAYRIRSIKG